MDTRHRRAAKTSQWGWAPFAALALLAGCSSADDAEGGSSAPWIPSDWVYGGQTGSLMPACGVAPAVLERGIPASAGGFVVYDDGCAALDPSAIVVLDESGEPVAFSVERIGDGVFFVQVGVLAPGAYRVVTSERPVPVDDDAGVDASDAGDEPEGSPSAAANGDAAQAFDVIEGERLPDAVGVLSQAGGACSATFELRLDERALLYAANLELELSIAGDDVSRSATLAEPGTLAVEDGVVRFDVPSALLEDLERGGYLLAVSAQVIGPEPYVVPDVAVASLEVPCNDAAQPQSRSQSDAAATCSVRGALLHGVPRLPPWLVGSLGAALGIALRRRRPAAPRARERD